MKSAIGLAAVRRHNDRLKRRTVFASEDTVDNQNKENNVIIDNDQEEGTIFPVDINRLKEAPKPEVLEAKPIPGTPVPSIGVELANTKTPPALKLTPSSSRSGTRGASGGGVDCHSLPVPHRFIGMDKSPSPIPFSFKPKPNTPLSSEKKSLRPIPMKPLQSISRNGNSKVVLPNTYRQAEKVMDGPRLFDLDLLERQETWIKLKLEKEAIARAKKQCEGLDELTFRPDIAKNRTNWERTKQLHLETLEHAKRVEAEKKKNNDLKQMVRQDNLQKKFDLLRESSELLVHNKEEIGEDIDGYDLCSINDVQVKTKKTKKKKKKTKHMKFKGTEIPLFEDSLLGEIDGESAIISSATTRRSQSAGVLRAPTKLPPMRRPKSGGATSTMTKGPIPSTIEPTRQRPPSASFRKDIQRDIQAQRQQQAVLAPSVLKAAMSSDPVSRTVRPSPYAAAAGTGKHRKDKNNNSNSNSDTPGIDLPPWLLSTLAEMRKEQSWSTSIDLLDHEMAAGGRAGAVGVEDEGEGEVEDEEPVEWECENQQEHQDNDNEEEEEAVGVFRDVGIDVGIGQSQHCQEDEHVKKDINAVPESEVQGVEFFDPSTSSAEKGRHKVNDARAFDARSLRRVTHDHVTVLIGKRRDSGVEQAVSVLFDKAFYSEGDAKQWWETNHNSFGC